ncbi:MAG: low specificity L-threonine aldolase [Burkholderiales bacterium]|nr:low specificity L-threonine aldolase [Burkholderiales bacterium]
MATVPMDFGSENTSPVHPAYVKAVVEANAGYATNFEAEPWTERALESLKGLFETDQLWAFTVSTGTAANAIAIGAMVPPYGSVLCHWDAHTMTDECGAPEMFSAGARQIALPGEHGRLSREALATYLREARIGVVHAIQPSIISLTNLTEAGTAYRPDDIAGLTEVARKSGLGVHMDGARFANAAAHVGATPAELSWKAGVEVLTLGTTKNGSFGAETIVAFTPKYNTSLAFLRKRSGHFAPKSRFLAAQVQAYVDDGLWLVNAKHANRAALRMAEGLSSIAGVSLVHPTEGNEVFASMPPSMSDALETAGCKFQRDWRLHPRHNRFVTSWATADEEIDCMLDVCARAAQPAS